MGSHVHLSIFWPSYRLAQLVAVIERISGSSADFVLKPYAADVTARSVCGGWQINMNNRKDDKQSALEWAEYIAAQHDKHPAPPEIKGKAFGISEAIGKTAQERARPALEAREAKYGWMAKGGGRKALRGPHIASARVSGILPNDFGKICEGSWVVVEAGGDGTTGPRTRQKAIGRLMCGAGNVAASLRQDAPSVGSGRGMARSSPRSTSGQSWGA
jgi:hypothetical protein